MSRTTPRISRPVVLALAAAIAILAHVSGARAADPPIPASGPVRIGDYPERILALKKAIIMREALREKRERVEAAREARRQLERQKHGAQAVRKGRHGERVKPVLPESDLVDATPSGPPVRVELPAGISSINSIPTNVPVNNPTGDPVPSTQAEEGIAMLGPNGVCAWNDGANFSSAVDAQQAAYTNNGGASWTDIGPPPKPVGGRWASDPVVTVNEKTGTFYYVGLIDFNSTSQNGIAFCPGSFSGGVFSWGTPRTIRSGPNAAIGFDKEWMVADSTTGNLYVTFTTFGAADTIIFQRSTDGGLTWGDPITMNSGTSFGFVQGSRPCVGPNGEVYVVWTESGPSFDFHKVRRSTNAGVSFASEAIALQFYNNFGTGGPGFNRDHGVNFPSIAVDRSTGPHRGRIYVAGNESVNWFDDPLGTLGNKAETEPNDTPASATSFTPGQGLTGSISGSSDLDYFSFSATQGKTYIFWAQMPGGSTLKYTLRVYCTNGTDRLAYGGDTQSGGFDGFAVWTAPASGTYYLRMGGISGGGSGSYTVWTAVDAAGVGEHGRDMRDAVVSWSDGGTSWATQVRTNDDAALYDNFLSEVGVSCEGYAYNLWYDYRDSPAANCGGIANIYLTRSTDGGVTWAANQRVTSVGTNFTSAPTNLQPNMGDYSGMSGGANVAMAWADGRATDVDVWGATLLATPVPSCPGTFTFNTGTPTPIGLPLQNPNAMYGNSYVVTISSDHPSWTFTPPSQTLSLGANGLGNASFSVTAPDTAPSSNGTLCFTVTAQGGGVCARCCVPTTLIGVPSGVPAAGAAVFALAGVAPNPATRAAALTISFSLPDGSPARIELLDLTGRRVLEREVGSLGGGNHVLTLGREAAALPAGIYVVRLSQGGRAASSKVVVMR